MFTMAKNFECHSTATIFFVKFTYSTMRKSKKWCWKWSGPTVSFSIWQQNFQIAPLTTSKVLLGPNTNITILKRIVGWTFDHTRIKFSLLIDKIERIKKNIRAIFLLGLSRILGLSGSLHISNICRWVSHICKLTSTSVTLICINRC